MPLVFEILFFMRLGARYKLFGRTEIVRWSWWRSELSFRCAWRPKAQRLGANWVQFAVSRWDSSWSTLSVHFEHFWVSTLVHYCFKGWPAIYSSSQMVSLVGSRIQSHQWCFIWCSGSLKLSLWFLKLFRSWFWGAKLKLRWIEEVTWWFRDLPDSWQSLSKFCLD